VNDFKQLKIKIANRERDRKLKEEEKRRKAELRLKKMIKKHDDAIWLTTDERMKMREDELDYDYKNTPLEKKQKFLDLMQAGRNLGQAAAEAGITTEIAAQVIVRNTIDIWPTKAVK